MDNSAIMTIFERIEALIDMIDWTTVIVTVTSALLSGGGIVVIATLKDKKYEAVQANILKLIESVAKTNDAWERITQQKFKDIAEAKQDVREKDAIIEKKDAKIDELYKSNSILRNNLDHARTAIAVKTITQCRKIACGEREPKITDATNINELLKID